MQYLLLICFSLFVFLTPKNITANSGKIAVHPLNQITEITGDELIYLLEGKAETVNGKPVKLFIVLYGKDSMVIDSIIREISILPPPLIKRRIEEKLAKGQLEKIEVKSSIFDSYQETMKDRNSISLSNPQSEELAEIIGLKLIPIVD